MRFSFHCAAALLFLTSPALAQEAAPIPLSVAFDPDTDEPIAMVARDKGFVVRDEAGDWRLLCAAGVDLSANGHFLIEGLAGGGLSLAHYRGLQHTDPTLCDLDFPDEDLRERHVADIDALGDRRYALTNESNSYDVYLSDDGGQDFSHAFSLPGGAAYFSVRVAPSDADRIYLVGVLIDTDTGASSGRAVFRSSDGGDSFETFLQEFPEIDARLLAIDPDDADRLYLTLTRGSSSHTHGDGGHDDPDQVLVSDDGGETWKPLIDLQLFGGFAIGEDASELWVGDGEGGLHRSEDRGKTFTEVNDELHISCIEPRGDRLWVCADSVTDAFSLGYSDDGGESFEATMRFNDVVGVHQCGGEPIAKCDISWAGWTFWHRADAGPIDVDPHAGHDDHADDTAPDAGHVHSSDEDDADDESTANDDDGCSCHVTTRGDLHSAGLWSLAILWVARRRRTPTR